MIAGRKLLEQAIERTRRERDNPFSIGMVFDHRRGGACYLGMHEYTQDAARRLETLNKLLEQA